MSISKVKCSNLSHFGEKRSFKSVHFYILHSSRSSFLPLRQSAPHERIDQKLRLSFVHYFQSFRRSIYFYIEKYYNKRWIIGMKGAFRKYPSRSDSICALSEALCSATAIFGEVLL